MDKNISEADVNTFIGNEENKDSKIPNEEEEIKIKFDPNDLFYDMSGDKYLVIFNHYEFDRESLHYYKNPLSKRNGTDEDVKALKKTFKKLGFKMEVYDDHNEDKLVYEKVWDTFLELRRRDFSSASCLCIAILTHGTTNDRLCAYDAPYDLKDVTRLFESHPTLAGKPKLFFVQACRGNNMDDGNRIETDGDDKRFIVTPSHADFLIVRSTVEDFISYRDCRGSWLIQELCKTIRSNHETLDLLHMMILVNQKIAHGYASNTPKDARTHNKRQMPETFFTLTKMVKFPSVPDYHSLADDKIGYQPKRDGNREDIGKEKLKNQSKTGSQCSLN